MLDKIFDEIRAERKRQNELWGEQNHPMLDIPFHSADIAIRANTYKGVNDSGKHTCWFAILQEEVYEAFSEIDPAKQRQEMIEVAAVAVQIIECLDRRMK